MVTSCNYQLKLYALAPAVQNRKKNHLETSKNLDESQYIPATVHGQERELPYDFVGQAKHGHGYHSFAHKHKYHKHQYHQGNLPWAIIQNVHHIPIRGLQALRSQTFLF